MHPGGHIHKGAAAPHGTMQGCKLVVGGGHQPHKMFAHHLGIGAGKGTLHIGVHYALCGYLGLDIVVYHLGVVLRAHAGQRSTLGLGDAQTLKGVLDVLGHIPPLAPHLGVGADIGDDVVHIQPGNGRAPVLHRHFVVGLQCFQAENAHPLGVVLFLGDFFHDLAGQAGAHRKGSVAAVPDIVNAAVNLSNIGLFGFKSSHSALSSFTAWKPSSMISFTSSSPPVRTIWASSSTWT